MRIQLTDPVDIIVEDKTGDLPGDQVLDDIMEDHCFLKISPLDIENLHALPKIALNRLYLRGDTVYEFYGWETTNGFMDTATGNVVMRNIGYVILG